MKDNQNKQPEFEQTPEGEVIGYISFKNNDLHIDSVQPTASKVVENVNIIESTNDHLILIIQKRITELIQKRKKYPRYSKHITYTINELENILTLLKS